jgi:hypothetical protein
MKLRFMYFIRQNMPTKKVMSFQDSLNLLMQPTVAALSNNCATMCAGCSTTQ